MVQGMLDHVFTNRTVLLNKIPHAYEILALFNKRDLRAMARLARVPRSELGRGDKGQVIMNMLRSNRFELKIQLSRR
jgi:hypothetical protein